MIPDGYLWAPPLWRVSEKIRMSVNKCKRNVSSLLFNDHVICCTLLPTDLQTGTKLLKCPYPRCHGSHLPNLRQSWNTHCFHKFCSRKAIFPSQMASNAENASIWWRHHEHDWTTNMQQNVWRFGFITEIRSRLLTRILNRYIILPMLLNINLRTRHLIGQFSIDMLCFQAICFHHYLLATRQHQHSEPSWT